MDVTEIPVLRRAGGVMSGYGRPWGIAGGWAIDLFLGCETRPHADVDIATLRTDQTALRALLGSAVVEKVVDGVVSDWHVDEMLPSGIHEVWATWPNGERMEFLLNDCDLGRGEWIFRRDARVRRPLASVFHHRGDTPYLAPEIVLLYKAKAPGVKDVRDFVHTAPRLPEEGRRWLEQAIVTAHPGHPWLGPLAAVGALLAPNPSDRTGV